jgi:ech hydrogenase subunit A
MTLVLLLILGPMFFGVLLLGIRSNTLRPFLVGLATLGVACGTVLLLSSGAAGAVAVGESASALTSRVMLCVELLMGVYVLYVGARARSGLIVVLMLAQVVLMLWAELGPGVKGGPGHPLFLDNFSLIMAVINGLVGGGIGLYAVGYMAEYHNGVHRDVADRQPMFFALLFVFMGAMFGLIFANELSWLFFFWELTTLCSFLLIGYTRTDEAQRNARRALVMNLSGGLAFASAIAWCKSRTGSLELQALIASKQSVALLPAALLCFAGITKSAQMPFSSWLLGAMVAPTPVSALLHSSTMVKAGVYLVLRMALVITRTKVGLLVALVGSVTFLIGSLAAITASDAKRVLAYSTVANLGLIVLCGGIGTAAAVWAGVLLIIFHALAKCLLFLCVGVVEHRLHSRDIESMSGLIKHMPHVAVMMLIGMAGMFLAPFGMLISKWAVLKAVVDAYAPLTVFIVFGSAATLFFWVKWMGKLLQVIDSERHTAAPLGAGILLTLYSLSGATFLACLFFPVVSAWLIDPYLMGVYGTAVAMSSGNIVIMTFMMLMLLLFSLSFINYGRGVRVTDAYLGGANLQSSVRFRGAAQQEQTVTIGNYYLRDLLSESWLARWGNAGASVCLGAMLVAAIL